MRERPILFSAPMVRAILSGSKSQTRRVVKPQPASGGACAGCGAVVDSGYRVGGDRLYVRETWQAIDGNERALRIMTEPHPSRGWIEYAATVPEGHEPPPRWRPSIHMPRWASRITLEVTGVRVERLQDISEADALAEGVFKKIGSSPGGEMDIVETATGSTLYYAAPTQAREEFRHLWGQINGPDSWAENPFVWVIEFKRIKP